MSLPAHSELAEMLVPMVARQNANAAKNVAARLSHLSMRVRGSHKISPYRLCPALVTAIPMKPQKVNATGIMKAECSVCTIEPEMPSADVGTKSDMHSRLDCFSVSLKKNVRNKWQKARNNKPYSKIWDIDCQCRIDSKRAI